MERTRKVNEVFLASNSSTVAKENSKPRADRFGAVIGYMRSNRSLIDNNRQLQMEIAESGRQVEAMRAENEALRRRIAELERADDNERLELIISHRIKRKLDQLKAISTRTTHFLQKSIEDYENVVRSISATSTTREDDHSGPSTSLVRRTNTLLPNPPLDLVEESPANLQVQSQQLDLSNSEQQLDQADDKNEDRENERERKSSGIIRPMPRETYKRYYGRSPSPAHRNEDHRRTANRPRFPSMNIHPMPLEVYDKYYGNSPSRSPGGRRRRRAITPNREAGTGPELRNESVEDGSNQLDGTLIPEPSNDKTITERTVSIALNGNDGDGEDGSTVLREAKIDSNKAIDPSRESRGEKTAQKEMHTSESQKSARTATIRKKGGREDTGTATKTTKKKGRKRILADVHEDETPFRPEVTPKIRRPDVLGKQAEEDAGPTDSKASMDTTVVNNGHSARPKRAAALKIVSLKEPNIGSKLRNPY